MTPDLSMKNSDTISFVWGRIYRRACLDGLRFNENLTREEDLYFNYQILPNCRQIKYLDAVLYYYRYRSDSLWHTTGSHDSLKVVKEFVKLSETEPQDSSLVLIRAYRSFLTYPSYETVLLLFRIALKLRWRDAGHRLGRDDCTELAWLMEQTTEESVLCAASEMVGEKSVSVIQKMLRQSLKRKSSFKPLQKSLRKELRIYTAYSRFSSWAVRTKREIFWLYGGAKRRLGLSNYTASRRISPSGGLVVAILGCDGAGKSTTLSYVKREFNKKLDVVSVYLGSGDGSSSILRKPMKLVARKVGGKGVGHAVEKEYAENKRISIKSRLYSVAKILWAVTLAKEKKKKLRNIVKARNNGLLVLTDRYPQIIIPGASDGPLLSRYRSGKGLLKRIADWEERIYELFARNAPDLVIKLTVSPETAIKRKPEMTVEEIRNKHSIIMNLDISEHIAIIDTSRPFEKTRGEVMKKIWEMI